jgi:hypothetical protein
LALPSDAGTAGTAGAGVGVGGCVESAGGCVTVGALAILTMSGSSPASMLLRVLVSLTPGVDMSTVFTVWASFAFSASSDAANPGTLFFCKMVVMSFVFK